MKKKLIILFLFTMILCSVFAKNSHESITAIQAGAQFGISSQKNLSKINISASESTYLYKDKEVKSALFFKTNAGIDFNEKNKIAGLSLEGLFGYSFKLSPIIKLDVATGINFYESSLINYIIQKSSKNTSYKITTSFAPILDCSVLFGVESLSLRAGVKGSFEISKAFDNYVGIMPYLSVGSDLAKLFK